MKLLRGIALIAWLIALIAFLIGGGASGFEKLVLVGLLLVLLNGAEVLQSLDAPIEIFWKDGEDKKS